MKRGFYQIVRFFQMSKIGLTEMVKGDPRKFEVWLEGRQEIYTIQAATVEQKDVWVKEIKKVLFEQLTELKGEKLRQYAEKWYVPFIRYGGLKLDSNFRMLLGLLELSL